MGIGKKLFLSFLAVISIHLLTYHLIFKQVIVEQMKTDRHEQFLQEMEAAKLVRFNQLMRNSVFKDPIEVKELGEQLPEDMMYRVTVFDANGNKLFSKTSQAYNLKETGKKIIAEYHFNHEPPSQGQTVIEFFNDDYDILASKGVSWTITYIYASIILIGAVLIYILIRWILRPVNELTRVTQDIKDGKRLVSFSYKANDEFGQLFRYFQDMVEQLRYSEERQHELISAIAHDFRTPLTTIKGYASFIATGRVTDLDKIQNRMKKMEEKASDLERLIDELQDFSQYSTELPLTYSRIHVHTFLQSLIEDYTEKTRESNLEFKWKLRVSDRLFIEGDQAKLRRVLQNLLNNAIYYNKPDGSILLTCDQREHHVVINVIDKGEGIAEEDLNKVFTKFYRAEKSRNRNSGGTGLGLTIAQSIIDRHGGHINVTSQQGEGSCFTVTIPIIRKHSTNIL